MADEARQDQETLVRTLVRRARLGLEGEGGFMPVAAVVNRDGDVQHLRGAGSARAQEPAARLQALLAALRQFATAGEIRAAAVCYDGRARVQGEETDAICVAVEHQAADPLQVVVPYSLDPPAEEEGPHAVEAGPFLMAPGAAQVFDAQD
jgi:hypothetical protein